MKSHTALESRSLHPENSVDVILRLSLLLTSHPAEMAALKYLAELKRNSGREPHRLSKDAFTWMLDFNQEPPMSINLFDVLPYMRDPLEADLTCLITLSKCFKS